MTKFLSDNWFIEQETLYTGLPRNGYGNQPCGGYSTRDKIRKTIKTQGDIRMMLENT